MNDVAGNKWYRGGLDSAVLPFAVRPSSAANHIRVGFEHKQSHEDKKTYAESHGRQVLLSKILYGMHCISSRDSRAIFFYEDHEK
jgi:hypothetical protein